MHQKRLIAENHFGFLLSVQDVPLLKILLPSVFILFIRITLTPLLFFLPSSSFVGEVIFSTEYAKKFSYKIS
jgi:hypothetical protein